jgi:hypothetical protein
MYKTESILGLIGSIIGAVFTFFCLAGTLIATFFFSSVEPLVDNILTNYAHGPVFSHGFAYESLSGFVVPIVAICGGAAVVIAAASFILGFIGTAKLNRDDKSGGVLLIVGGALALLSVAGFIPFVLLLIGGIMAVSKKPASSQTDANKSA